MSTLNVVLTSSTAGPATTCVPTQEKARKTSATLAELLCAADKGDADAAAILGFKYEHAYGVPVSSDTARGYFDEAAHNGNPDAMLALAAMAKSRSEKERHCRMALDECKWPHAALMLGSIYLFDDEHTKDDILKAADLLRIAVDGCIPEATRCLAHALVLRGHPGDFPEALRLLRAGSMRDEVDCMFMLAMIIAVNRTTERMAEFSLLMARAAELGSAEARETLEKNGIARTAVGPLAKYYSKKRARSSQS